MNNKKKEITDRFEKKLDCQEEKLWEIFHFFASYEDELKLRKKIEERRKS